LPGWAIALIVIGSVAIAAGAGFIAYLRVRDPTEKVRLKRVCCKSKQKKVQRIPMTMMKMMTMKMMRKIKMKKKEKKYHQSS
jgi:hypothetical protein